MSQSLLAAGVYAWLMLWRVLPVGKDRESLPLLGITLLAAALTVGFEYCWYRFGTRINPMRVLWSELDVEYGLHPVGRVLVVVYTWRGRSVRMISARPATARERREYGEGL